MNNAKHELALDLIKLEQATLTIIQQKSVSEFELIKLLQSEPYNIFDQNIFQDNLALFQTHFLVYHVLYKLNDFGINSKSFYLDILPTSIQLMPYQESDGSNLQVGSTDSKLRDYYLDLTHFSDTDEQEVETLLDDFWQKFIVTNNQEQLVDALELFGYSAPPTLSELKKDYRQLSNTHHPDKGGSVTEFQKLNSAYRIIALHI